MADTPEEKRRRQNRESQRRYRQRHKREPTRQFSSTTTSSSSPDRNIPQGTWTAIAGTFSPEYSPYTHEYNNDRTLLQSEDPTILYGGAETNELYESSTTDPWDSWLRATSLCSHSFPAESMDIANQLALPVENTAGNGSLGESGDFQLQSILLSSVSQELDMAGAVLSPMQVSSSGNRHSKKTLRNSSQKMSSSEGKSKKHAGRSDPSPTLDDSATSKVKSRAEQMITEVEKLYNFGVSIGVLPEDRDMQVSLRRLKMRFRSLRPASESSLESSSDGVGDRYEE